jgi:hypothetical protein
MRAQNHFNTFLILFLLNFTLTVSAQNKSFCIGANHCGLNIGNPVNSIGLKLNLFDKNIQSLSGVNLALSCSTDNTKGFSIGVFSVNSINYYGLAVGGFFAGSESTFNGIGIAGLSVIADTMNDVFFSIYGNTKWNHTLIKELNGISVGFMAGINCETINGLAIGALNYSMHQKGVTIGIANYTENLNGMQFGLWNVAANKKRFKRMPFINFNFKK